MSRSNSDAAALRAAIDIYYGVGQPAVVPDARVRTDLHMVQDAMAACVSANAAAVLAGDSLTAEFYSLFYVAFDRVRHDLETRLRQSGDLSCSD